MGEDVEQRKKVVKQAILFYFGILGLLILVFPIIIVILRVVIWRYFEVIPLTEIVNWLQTRSWFDIFLFFPYTFFINFVLVFIFELITIIYTFWTSTKEVRFKEIDDRSTKFFAGFLKYFRSVKIFSTRKRLKELSEANPNEMPVPMTFRKLLKTSTIVNLTIAYLVSRFILIFIKPVYIPDEIFWWRLTAGPLLLIWFYRYSLTSLPIFWHKQLDIKIINDVIPFEKFFRYSGIIVILSLFYDLVGIFSLASLASLETFDIFMTYSIVLLALIAHIFLSLLLVNVAMYARGNYRIRLKYAAKGLLDLVGTKNIYFGVEEYYKEHPEESEV